MFDRALSDKLDLETIESWNCEGLVNAMHITASVFINDHFDPWEQIFYGEFDGRRRKRVLVKIIGE